MSGGRTAAAMALLASVLAVAVAGADTAGAAACPAYDQGIDRGTVFGADLKEASGLVAGRANPGVLWTHADSGYPPRLVALDATDGTVIAVYDLTGATNVDWEDIAIGPGPVPDQSYLYVADTGGNNGPSARVIYRVPEPTIAPGTGTAPQPLAGAEPLPYSYPAGDFDVEVLLSDPANGDLYLVTKNASARVFHYPAPHTGASVELAQVATVDFSQVPILPGATGGDISPAGDEILIRAYFGAFVWPRADGQTIAAALSAEPCPAPIALEPQGEAIGYAADGLSYFSLSERAGQGERPLFEYLCNHGFGDVPGWVEGPVDWLVCNDFATGFPDSTFRPNASITRAATARMLHRIAGSPLSEGDCGNLTDVPPWAEDAICWLIDNGHATGFGDNTFRPNASITRAATARVLFRVNS